MQPYLSDIAEGASITGFFVLKDFATQKSKGGKDYIKTTISDKSTSVTAMCWEVSGNLGVTRQDIGSIVKIAGTMNSFNGEPQIAITKMRAASEADKEQFDITQLIEVAPIDVEATVSDIETLIASIEDDEYKKFALTLLARFKDKFVSYPAGKTVHHAFRSGLVMHTRNMMVLADFISQMYPDTLNRSLLLAGTLAHDIAKTKEFDVSELMSVKDYSKSGQLLGHLYMGAQIASEIAIEIEMDSEKKLLLEHLILSHHGDGEMGSPVTPKCAEAECLHLIDMMDSRLEIYAEEYKKIEPACFSEKQNWALSHKIYRPQ